MAYIRTAISQNGSLVGTVVKLTANPRIAASFDSPGQAVVLDLATSGVAAGTYNQITVDIYGRVVTGTNVAFLTGNQTITLSGDATGSGATSIPVTLANTGVTAGTYTSLSVDAKGRVLAGTNPGFITGNQTITISGDATGSGATAIALTLANTGVTAGTYTQVVVNAKGLVTLGANPASTETLATVTGRGATTATALSLTNTTVSSSTTTGALVVTGGVGVGGAVNVGGALNVGGAAGVTGNLTVTGNLIVNGTTTTVNSTTVTVDDPVFTLGGDTAPVSDDNRDRGIEFRWHNGTTAQLGFFGFDDSTGRFIFIPQATNTSEVFSGTVGTVEANLLGNVTGNASTATALAAAQPIALSGDATGTANFAGNTGATIAVTLANSGVVAGTYNNIIVNAKGLATGGSNIAYLTGNQTITVSGDATGSGATAIALTLANTGVTAGTYTSLSVDAKGRVLAGTNPGFITGNQTITLSGDATGSGATAITVTLANTGVTAGTHAAVAVNSKGLVTAGVPVTLTGDVTGTSTGAGIATTLAAVGTAGTYDRVVTDSRGRVVAGFGWQRATVNSASYTLQANDTYVGVTFTTTGTSTITLPVGAPEGRQVIIKDEGGNAWTNNITITASGAETIDGALTTLINVNHESLMLVRSNGNWWII